MEQSKSISALRQAQAAIKKHWYVPVLLGSLALLFLAGSWYGHGKASSQKAAGGRRILHYVDPMNPAHTSPEPGLAPCGMKMEPVYADDEGQSGGAGLPPGSIKISSEKQQLIGVRVASVEKSPYTYMLRTVGKVAVDDNLVYRLNAYIDGWIVKIYNNTTSGSLVRKDEPLATFYNRDLPSTLQTFYYSLDSLNIMTKDPNISPSQRDLLVAQKLTSEGVLMNLGMGKVQIDDLARSRELTQEITINAPATSIVLARNITTGQRFAAGAELYQLADLSRVWILADLYENEAKYVQSGEKVGVTMPDQIDQRTATVSAVLPLFDPATFTLKVRLEMDNPKFTLRPGMFTDVEFPIKMPPTINVPVDAIMDSGDRQTVFVDRGNGYFEPRQVKIGWRLGDRVQILAGLKTGERIATSGNFLIDSESRMKLAAAGFFGNVVKDPVCNMNLDEGKAKNAGLKMDYQGKTYYFCSEECQHHFEKHPARYVQEKAVIAEASGNTAGSNALETATAKDIVSGQEVKISQAKAEGLTSDYGGKTYYFSSYANNHEFDKNPERYIQQAATRDQTPVTPEKTKEPMCDMPMAAEMVKPEATPHPHAHLASQAKPESAAEMAKDPVCSLAVAMGTAKQAGLTSEYQGKTYYFDTPGCKQRFENNPQRYISGGTGSTVASPVPVRTYPKTPLESDTTLRYGRKIMQGRPPVPAQAMPRPMPQGSAPAMPQGGAHPMPNGTPGKPPGPAQVPLQATPPTIPQSPAPAVIPHGATQPGAQAQAQMPQESKTMPPGAQVQPQGSAQTMPKELLPQEDANKLFDYRQNLLRRVRRGPTEAMRRSALEGQRQREEYEKRQKEDQGQPQATTSAKPQVKSQEQQACPQPPEAQPPVPPQQRGQQQ